MTPSYCVKESKPCVIWAEKYFKICLCNLKDEISFGLGFFSLICWGVAEIPQIITNFQTKSSHGVSLTFLLTWVVGDMFNLMGCLLEPATLPTQYYTALLYTVTTLILASQSFYYEYIYSWCKRRHQINNEEAHKDETKPLILKPSDESVIPIPNGTRKSTPRQEFYYTSARSMAGNGTPPFCSYMRAAKSGPSAMPLNNDSSSDDEAPTVPFIRPTTQPMRIPRSNAGIYGTFLALSATLPMHGNALKEGRVLLQGRKLLSQEHAVHSALGQCLGWLMAAIYIGGRLPQIWLNVQRGSVEGLNPLMFVFALIANITYVGSILVKTTEWESIKANLPWLLDAVVCVALDLFIIMQYIYYRKFRSSARNGDYEDYNEARKAASS